MSPVLFRPLILLLCGLMWWIIGFLSVLNVSPQQLLQGLTHGDEHVQLLSAHKLCWETWSGLAGLLAFWALNISSNSLWASRISNEKSAAGCVDTFLYVIYLSFSPLRKLPLVLKFDSALLNVLVTFLDWIWLVFSVIPIPEYWYVNWDWESLVYYFIFNIVFLGTFFFHLPLSLLLWEGSDSQWGHSFLTGFSPAPPFFFTSFCVFFCLFYSQINSNILSLCSPILLCLVGVTVRATSSICQFLCHIHFWTFCCFFIFFIRLCSYIFYHHIFLCTFS